MYDTGDGGNDSACGTSTWGEVEDYSINLIPSTIPPVAGTIHSLFSTICTNYYTFLSLTEYTGDIQWQFSQDGISNWISIPGADNEYYQTDKLSATSYYRVEVTHSIFPPVYSDVYEVSVIAPPGDPGPIMGKTSVCEGETGVLYSVDFIENANSYSWSTGFGASGSSTTESILLNFGFSSDFELLMVRGENEGCVGPLSSLGIDVHAQPVKPSITINEHLLHSDAASGNQWHNEDGPIPGATDQEYLVTESGDYYVIVTLDDCISPPSDTVNVILTGIENPFDHNIRVYPNPFSNELIIDIPVNISYITIEVFNAIGQRVYQNEVMEKTVVNTLSFTPGVYVVKLSSGENIYQVKVVKE